MVIKIDLNLLPARFKSVIIHDINREYRHHHNLKTRKNVGYDDKYIIPRIDNNHNIITLDSDDKSDLRKIERMVKDILITLTMLTVNQTVISGDVTIVIQV